MDHHVLHGRLALADVVFEAAGELVRVGERLLRGHGHGHKHDQAAGGVQQPQFPWRLTGAPEREPASRAPWGVGHPEPRSLSTAPRSGSFDATDRQEYLDAMDRQEYLDAMASDPTLETLSAPIDETVGASSLDRLQAAAATADELRMLSDALLDRYVQAARADGRSWTEIGTALGVTKQAAHERFVDAPLTWPTNFNEPAREVVARALTEARGFGHRYLGTEHLLLALTGDRGLAGATLAELGVDDRVVRDAMERLIGRGHSGEGSTLGITPRTKRVFEDAINEAKRLGSQRCADNEHLLLALARSDGVASDILAAQGANADVIPEQLARLLEREAPEIAAKLRATPRRRARRRSRA